MAQNRAGLHLWLAVVSDAVVSTNLCLELDELEWASERAVPTAYSCIVMHPLRLLVLIKQKVFISIRYISGSNGIIHVEASIE